MERRLTSPTGVLTATCAGCGTVVDAPSALVAPVDRPWPWSCPARVDGDDIDHVLVPQVELHGVPLVTSDSTNPFVRFRGRLGSYQLWRGAGRDDESYVALVEALDAAVTAVAGRGFRVTPVTRFPLLDQAVGARVWVKDETGNVAGSHKGRHLFGVLLWLRVMEELGRPASSDLVIASCGNAARAAAVLAAAAGRRLTAFVPAEVDPAVAAQLTELGARVVPCPRDGRAGDPCYRHFREAVAGGAVPFSCQGPDNGFTIEGASTLAWEVADALPCAIDRVVIQVGGGALATACARGFDELAWRPVFDTVQTEGAHPLHRSVARLREQLVGAAAADEVVADAARHRGKYMWPWESEPASVARGILDDETYDWLAVVRAMLWSGGTAVVATEEVLVEANQLARSATGIDVDETGSAGLAGLLVLARAGHIADGADVLVLFTGGRPPTAAG